MSINDDPKIEFAKPLYRNLPTGGNGGLDLSSAPKFSQISLYVKYKYHFWCLLYLDSVADLLFDEMICRRVPLVDLPVSVEYSIMLVAFYHMQDEIDSIRRK